MPVKPAYPRTECPRCHAAVSLAALEEEKPCYNCTASFRVMAINAMINYTALHADYQQLHRLHQEMDSENDVLRAQVEAFTASTEDPDLA